MDEPLITPSQQRPSDSKQELERQFAIFTVLWSLAALLVVWHRLEAGLVGTWSMLIHAAIGTAAITQLIRPTWAIPCALLGAFQLVYAVAQMPFISTTDFMWMFFGGAICISYLTSSIVHRSLRTVSPIGLFRSFAPCLRILLVLVMAALSVARLNWAFVRIETSPVAVTLRQFRGDAIVPDWIAYLTVSMLLVVDLFLAASLLIPSLRRFAVGFGSCYFAWQALLGFGEARMLLPLMLVGLYLFTSMELANRIHAAFHRWVRVPEIRATGIPVVTGLLSIAVIVLSRQPTGNVGPISHQQVVAVGYASFVLLWLLVLVTHLIDGRPRLTWISLMLRNPAHYAWIGLFLLVAASPYLGLGTWGRFSDFSGMRTTGGHNNHLLIPQTYLVEHEKDVVEVVTASDPYLEQLALEAKVWTWFDLVNYLNSHPDTSLTFNRGGEQFIVDRAGDIAEFSTPNSWISRKLLAYRPSPQTRLADANDQIAQVMDR